MSVNGEEYRDQELGHTSKATNLVDLLRWRAMRQPDLLAYTFLTDGEREEARLTYGELDHRARAVAGWLQDMRVTRERTLLIYPPGLDYINAFFGCLYAGAVAVPVPSINPAQAKRGLSHLETIANDAQPILALTTSNLLSKLDRSLLKDSRLSPVHWRSLDQVTDSRAEEWRPPKVNWDTLAYLQYTSGSTAAAKGVMVSHGNVLHNSADMDQRTKHEADSVFVSWLPHFHDMGLVYGIIQPLYKGVPCVLMSPVSFVQRPIRWLKAISDYRATYSAGPNFAYHHCTQRITPEQCATLDLSAWRGTVNGAEPVRKETMDQFAQTFKPYGFNLSSFCPAYGLAEATLMVTVSLEEAVPSWLTVDRNALERNRVVETTDRAPGGLTMVGCGRPGPGTRILIVNPNTLFECLPGEVGEIWVSGPSVSQGYWNRPEENERTFKAYIKGKSEGPFLRTGDLGFIKNGELFISGRLKDLIIITGRNHYPQDIELTVEKSHPSLRPGSCAAFAVEVDGQERLIVAAELDRKFRPNCPRPRHGLEGSVSDGEIFENPATEIDDAGGSDARGRFNVEAVIKSIRRAVAERHGIQIYKVVMLRTGGIPRTSSGKTKRNACRESFLSGSLMIWGTNADTETVSER